MTPTEADARLAQDRANEATMRNQLADMYALANTLSRANDTASQREALQVRYNADALRDRIASSEKASVEAYVGVINPDYDWGTGSLSQSGLTDSGGTRITMNGTPIASTPSSPSGQPAEGAFSPSGTGMVWSGTGWTSPNNVSADKIAVANAPIQGPTQQFDTIRSDVVDGVYQVTGIKTQAAKEFTPVTNYDQGFGTFYTPYGNQRQIELVNTRATLDKKSGELGFYQVPMNPHTGKPRTGVYGVEAGGMLIGGGGRNAAQSGMFNQGVAGTPDIINQWNNKFAETANVNAANAIRANPDKYSKLGSEAYFGQVAPLDGRTLSPDTQMARYPSWTGNLANLVQQSAPSKSEYGGANVPWSIPLNSPYISYMDEKGLQGAAPNVFDWVSSMTYKGDLYGVGSRLGNRSNPTPEPYVPILTGEGFVMGKASSIVPTDTRTIYDRSGWTGGPTAMDAGIPAAMEYGLPFNPIGEKGEVKQIPMQSGGDMILPAPFITRNAPSETMGDGKIFGVPVPGLAFFQGGEKRQATVNADKTTTFAVTPIASPFEVWQGGLSEKVYGGLGGVFSIGRSPVTGEKAKSTHDAVTRMFGAWTNKNPMFAPLAATASVGREAMDKPVEAGIFVAEGIAFGGLMRGAGAVYGGLARVPMAEAAISQGGKWRTALQASDFLTSKAVPGALTGMYGIDVSARSTDMFSNFKTGNVVQRASPILALETVPMMAGMGIGFNAPEIASFAYRSAVKTPGKVSEAVFTARQRMAGYERVPAGTNVKFDFTVDPNVSGPGKTGFNVPTRKPYEYSDKPFGWGKKRLGDGGFIDIKPTEVTTPFMGQATKPASGPTRPTFVGSFSSEGASPKAPRPYDLFGEMGGPQLQMQREPVVEPSRKLGYKPASTFDFQKYMRKDGVNVDLYRQSMGVTTSHDTPFEREMMGMDSPASNRQRASSPFAVGQPISRSGSFWEQRRQRNTMAIDFAPDTPGVPSLKRTPSVSPMGISSPFISQKTRTNNEVAPTPFIRPTPRPTTRQTTDPFQTPQPRITTQPKPTIIPPGGFPLLGGGGGTSGPAFGMGLDRWANVNPTADLEYLSGGMRDPFSGKKSRTKSKCRHTTPASRAKCSRAKRNG